MAMKATKRLTTREYRTSNLFFSVHVHPRQYDFAKRPGIDVGCQLDRQSVREYRWLVIATKLGEHVIDFESEFTPREHDVAHITEIHYHGDLFCLERVPEFVRTHVRVELNYGRVLAG